MERLVIYFYLLIIKTIPFFTYDHKDKLINNKIFGKIVLSF